MDIGGAILNALGTILYPLCSVIFLVIQLVQSMFYGFAGIGKIYYKGEEIKATNSGQEDETGLIYHLFQTQLVKDMLISIALLAVFLLIIFTVMAFIKNAYSAKPKSWQEIIGNAFKGLANFVFIPVCCLLGVWLGNILLNAINGATSKGGASYMDRKLFISCAYNANKIRADEMEEISDAYLTKIETLVDAYEIISEDDSNSKKVQFDKNHNRTDVEYFANVVDQVFAETEVDIIGGWGDLNDFYHLGRVNYLILVVGGVFMLYVLASLTFGMIKRMFFLLMLFIISPAMCSMYPLDDGKMVGSWKGDFIKQTIGAYSAVAGMNLFFSLLPLIEDINLVPNFGLGLTTGLASSLVTLFLTVAGLFVVKDLINMINGYIGGENAYASGSSLMGQTTKKIGGYTNKATKGVFSIAGRVAGAGGFFSRSGQKALWDSVAHGTDGKGGIMGGLNNLGKTVTGVDVDDAIKSYKDSKKAGQDEARTNKDKKELKNLIEAYDPNSATATFDADKILRLARKLGVEEEAYKKLAGAKGMSVDEYKENVSLQKEFAKQQKAFDLANARSKNAEATIDQALAALSAGDAANYNGQLGVLERIFGISDIGAIMSNSGLTGEEFLNQLRQGVQISADKLDVDDLVAGGMDRNDAINRVAAGNALNQMIDKQRTMSEAVEEAGEAFKEAADNLKKMHARSDASEPVFDASDIAGIKNAIETAMRDSSGAAVSFDTKVSDVMDDLAASTRKVAEGFKNIDIDKAIEKANKK